MDTIPTQVIALLSIKPKFAEAIIAGRKKVEFRKTRFTQRPDVIVLYASAPVQRIVAFFEVTHIKELTPKGLWRQFRDVGCIDYAEFLAYYQARATGLAIGVGNVIVLETPASLYDFDSSLTPPQSFRYLCEHSLLSLRN